MTQDGAGQVPEKTKSVEKFCDKGNKGDGGIIFRQYRALNL